MSENHNERPDYRVLVYIIGIVALVLSALMVLTAPANAHQPYGGCDEAWQAPRSQGAAHCRDHGWTVRGRFVIGPRLWVQYLNVKPCRYEDSDGLCYWDARRRGNGLGWSYIKRGDFDGRHRIWRVRGFAR